MEIDGEEPAKKSVGMSFESEWIYKEEGETNQKFKKRAIKYGLDHPELLKDEFGNSFFDWQTEYEKDRLSRLALKKKHDTTSFQNKHDLVEKVLSDNDKLIKQIQSLQAELTILKTANSVFQSRNDMMAKDWEKLMDHLGPEKWSILHDASYGERARSHYTT